MSRKTNKKAATAISQCTYTHQLITITAFLSAKDSFSLKFGIAKRTFLHYNNREGYKLILLWVWGVNA
jgi:hypothetical protein